MQFTCTQTNKYPTLLTCLKNILKIKDIFSHLQVHNTTPMYTKVWNNDGTLESISNKRDTALKYNEHLYIVTNLIRQLIFLEETIDELNFIIKYFSNLNHILCKYSEIKSKTSQVKYFKHVPSRRNFVNLLQHECFSILSGVCQYMKNMKSFLQGTTNITFLNIFIRITASSATFINRYISKSETFDLSKKQNVKNICLSDLF